MFKIIDTFSYEDIYELLRAEKLSTDLQPLKRDDFKKVSEYLKMKEKLLLSQDESVSLLSSQKRAKIQLELDNAKRTLRDLYEKRERKVLNRAIVTVRSGAGLRDTTNMLKNEQRLYENIISLLESSKDSFFNYILSLGREGEDPMKEVHELKRTVEKEVKELTEPKKADVEIDDKKEKVKLRFLEDIQEFYGEDLKTYGPYKKGDLEELPAKIGKLLISQNKARAVESEGQDSGFADRTGADAQAKPNSATPEATIGKQDESSKTDKHILSKVQEENSAQGNSSQTQAETKDKETRTEMGGSSDGSSA